MVISVDARARGAGDSLVSAAINGEQGAFDKLYRKYQPRAVRYASRRKANDAEGVANLALFDVFRALTCLREQSEAGFTSYLYRALDSHIATGFRKRALVTESLDDELAEQAHSDDPDPGRTVAGEDWVKDLMGRLDEHERTVVWLRYVEGMTATEVADRLDASSSNIYQIQHRALKRLRYLAAGAAFLGLVVLSLWYLGQAGPTALSVDQSPADQPVLERDGRLGYDGDSPPIAGQPPAISLGGGTPFGRRLGLSERQSPTPDTRPTPTATPGPADQSPLPRSIATELGTTSTTTTTVPASTTNPAPTSATTVVTTAPTTVATTVMTTTTVTTSVATTPPTTPGPVSPMPVVPVDLSLWSSCHHFTDLRITALVTKAAFFDLPPPLVVPEGVVSDERGKRANLSQGSWMASHHDLDGTARHYWGINRIKGKILTYDFDDGTRYMVHCTSS